MYYNHPIHGNPDKEEIQELQEELNESWICPTCTRTHPGYHTACFHCHPTFNKMRANKEAG